MPECVCLMMMRAQRVVVRRDCQTVWLTDWLTGRYTSSLTLCSWLTDWLTAHKKEISKYFSVLECLLLLLLLLLFQQVNQLCSVYSLKQVWFFSAFKSTAAFFYHWKWLYAFFCKNLSLKIVFLWLELAFQSQQLNSWQSNFWLLAISQAQTLTGVCVCCHKIEEDRPVAKVILLLLDDRTIENITAQLVTRPHWSLY